MKTPQQSQPDIGITADALGLIIEGTALRMLEYNYLQTIRVLDQVYGRHRVHQQEKIEGSLAERQFLDATRERMGYICKKYENLSPHTPELQYREALIEEYLLSEDVAIFGTEVVDLGLPVRIENRLAKAGIMDLGKLVITTETTLQQHKFSQNGIGQIRKALFFKNKYMRLGMSFVHF